MQRLRIFLYRMCLLITAIWALVLVPFPSPFLTLVPLKNVLVVFTGVVWTGKMIMDTFFYDRYWP